MCTQFLEFVVSIGREFMTDPVYNCISVAFGYEFIEEIKNDNLVQWLQSVLFTLDYLFACARKPRAIFTEPNRQ